MKQFAIAFFVAGCLSGLAASLIPVPLVKGIAGCQTPDLLWYQFNEGSGTTVADTSTDGGDGATTDADWATGKSGSGFSLDFNGTTDDLASDSTVNYGSNTKITVELWCFFDSTSGTRIIAESSANWTANGGSFAIAISGGTQLLVGITKGTLRRSEQIAVPATGAWFHLGLLLDLSVAGGDIKIYKDGTEQGTTIVDNQITGTSNFSDYVLYMGARASSSLWYDGKIDDFRIYSGDQTSNLSCVVNNPQ